LEFVLFTLSQHDPVVCDDLRKPSKFGFPVIHLHLVVETAYLLRTVNDQLTNTDGRAAVA